MIRAAQDEREGRGGKRFHPDRGIEGLIGEQDPVAIGGLLLYFLHRYVAELQPVIEVSGGRDRAFLQCIGFLQVQLDLVANDIPDEVSERPWGEEIEALDGRLGGGSK